jgi:hypothetical protein
MRLRFANIVIRGWLLAPSGCRPASPSNIWIIPRGYVGWLGVEYSVTGTPALPMEGGQTTGTAALGS